MHNYHTSYRARKRRKINDICAKMREAKERKRLAEADKLGKAIALLQGL